jgi:sugar lactone lactonase YvrE
VAVSLSAGTAYAAPGDPYVVYTANAASDGAVILRTEPATGALVEISRNGAQGALFSHPYDLAIEADGGLVVADMGNPNQRDGAVIRVDPLTGRQSLVSAGGSFYDPAGIAVGPGGVLYVLDNLAANNGGVIAVDPRTGAQKVIATNVTPALFSAPFGIAVDHDGTLVVVNRSTTDPLPTDCLVPTGSVIRVNPATGAQTPISELDRLSRPLGLAIDSDRSIVVANECAGPNGVGLVRVNPLNGAQAEATPNGSDDVLRTPERVAFTPSGDMLVTDYRLGADGDGGIVKVDRGTQAQSVVSSDNLFNHPLGIATVVNRPPTAALAVGSPLVAAGRRVSLDASGSRDPEGLRLVYEWDLNGDGSFEVGSGTTAGAMPAFAVGGRKVVRVRVNDPHGGRAVAVGTLTVDGSVPVVTQVRAARVLGVPAGRKRARRSPLAATTIRFRLSEAATVRVVLQRARRGRRAKDGPCRPRAKRGRRCTAWSQARVIRRSLRAGDNAIALRARGLTPGRFQVVVTATDRAGNRSPRRVLPLRVVRLPR